MLAYFFGPPCKGDETFDVTALTCFNTSSRLIVDWTPNNYSFKQFIITDTDTDSFIRNRKAKVNTI